MAEGLRSSVGVAAPPYTKGPYTWDQVLSFGANTARTAVATATANAKLLGSYLNSSATSGDARAAYLRLWISGAAGSGEALRAFTTVNDVAANTAHGAHVSLSLGTSGSITGLGVALRATYQIPNAAVTNGTFAAIMAELYSDGASSDIGGATRTSVFRVVNSGNATGMGETDKDAVLFDIEGFTIGDALMIRTNTNAATHGIKCNIGGTRYDLLVTTAHS
jgi:hypothetical protein